MKKYARILLLLLAFAVIFAACDSGNTETHSETTVSETFAETTTETSATEAANKGENMIDAQRYPKISCVGDSITYGAWAADRETGSYPARLQAKLGDEFTVENFGFGGSSYVETEINYKPYMKSTQYAESLAFNPDIVIIMLGTNDTHSWAETKPQFKEAVRTMVKSYAALESEPVIYLCSPLCRYDNPTHNAAISGEIRPILEEVAEEEGCTYVNLYSKTVGKAYCFYDKLHPNDTGYEYLSELIYDMLSGKY